MIFGLLLNKNVATYNVNLIFTYSDDDSFVSGLTVTLDNVGNSDTYIRETSELGVASFTGIELGTYNIIVNSETIDTIAIEADLQDLYQVAKTSNISQGYMYNYPTINTGKVAPTGWHIPTSAEYATLEANWGSEPLAYAAMIEGGSSGLELKIIGERNSSTGLFSSTTTIYTSLATSTTSLYQYRESGTDLRATGGSSTQSRVIRLVRDDDVGWSSSEVVTDLDGNVYNTVKIGNQIWTVQNWACTQLNDGTPIDNLRTPTEWTGATGAGYCAYENNSQNVFITYGESNVLNGRLYSGNILDNILFLSYTDVYVPNDSDISTLKSYLTSNGFSGTEGTALKDDVSWNGTNDYDFTALLSGIRETDGSFNTLSTMYWSTTAFDANNNNMAYIDTTSLFIIDEYRDTNSGISIRMLVDPVGEYAEDGAKYTDLDGNVYDVIQIGTQYWLAQNWACTKYTNGSSITEIKDNAIWAADTTGARCDYDNDKSYVYK